MNFAANSDIQTRYPKSSGCSN